MRVSFGAFEVDLASGELTRSGSAHGRLQEQPLSVLAALVEEPGRLVSREELRRRLWPGDVHVDYDRGLNKAVLKLRVALGDSAEAPRLIGTVPRRGYRFLAEVQRAADAVPPRGETGASGSTTAPARRGAPRLVAFLSFAAAVGLVWAAALPQGRALPTQPARALAVLPFQHFGGGEDDAVFSLGLTDTLITRLSVVSSLTVRPTSSVSHYAERPISALEAARELQVDHVLEGSVQRRAGRVRLSVRLLRVQDGQPLWAEVLEEDVGDYFDLQDRLSQQVASRLSLRLSREEAQRLRRRHTTSVEAWEQYQRGRYFLDRSSPENLRKSLAAFKRAAELDPEFALAHAGIALGYSAPLTWGMIPRETGIGPMEEAAARAAELDDSLALVQLALAAVASFRWDWQEEERAYQRAIALEPNLAKTYAWYSFTLALLGRQDESQAMRRRAFELDPTGPVTKTLYAVGLDRAGRTQEAIAQLEGVLELEPGFYWAVRSRGIIHLDQGHPEEAIPLFRETGARSLLTLALVRSGQPKAARRVLDQMLADATSGRYVSPFNLAKAHAALGNVEEAFVWLERAYRGQIWELALMNTTRELAALRGDPRLADLARRVGLPPPPGAERPMAADRAADAGVPRAARTTPQH